ncbi:MAG: DUF3465 domain-containing protein [Chromatiales bacterium]|jgi:hypothetical protein
MKLRFRRLIQILTLALIGGALWLQQRTDLPPDPRFNQETAAPITEQRRSEVDAAFAARQSNVIVSGGGTVARILADDREGSRHQRFILELDSGLTLLVAHNIDIADRIPELRVGGAVTFRGEYEWNDKGGVLHWTHKTLRGNHEPGWLVYEGIRYD